MSPYVDRKRQRAYQASWLQHRRAIAIDYLGGRCARCGSDEQLEVDHVDPATKVSHRMWSWSRPRLLAELAKCQLLCRTCHLEKTLSDRRAAQKPREHGHYSTYKSGCRCEPCRVANREYTRRWREARSA